MTKKKMMKLKSMVTLMKNEIKQKIKELKGGERLEGRSYWNGFDYPVLMGLFDLLQTVEFMMDKYINYYKED